MQDIIFQENWPIDLAKNKLITELPYLGKQYKISFDLLITKLDFSSSDFLSIIHFTLGQDVSVYGDRTPGVWVYKDKALTVASAVNGNRNFAFNTAPPNIINENVWHKVQLSQTLLDGKVNFHNKIYYY